MFIVICSYLLAVAVWVLFTKSAKSPWEAGKTNHWLFLSFSIVAGIVGGNTFVTFTGFSYRYGTSAFLFFVGVFFGLLVLHLFGSKIRGMHSENIGAELVLKNYPTSTHKIFFAANLLRFFCVSVIQTIAGSLLLNKITGIPYLFCTIIMVGSILIYTYKHGFGGVIKTDVVQMIFILLPLLVLMAFFYGSGFESDLVEMNNSHHQIEPIGTSNGILFTVFGFLFVLGSLDIWQRYTLIKDKFTSAMAMATAIIALIICGWGIYVISLIASLTDSALLENPDRIFIIIFTKNLLPNWLIIPMSICVLSAIISTADTFIHGASLLLLKLNKNITSTNRIYRRNLCIISLVILTIANIYTGILDLAIFMANIVFAFSPFLLILVFGGKPSAKMVNTGLIVSSLFAIFVGIFSSSQLGYSYGTLALSVLFMLLGLLQNKFSQSQKVPAQQ